ncbi:Abi family protein [Leuconostocaceae bacterium ESL0958]|nr:Abi family protein [Leuconostocaceae bacterium ESL0958]
MDQNIHPFENWNEQLRILNEKHNILIESKQTAIQVLQDYSYYTLVNGYQNALEKEPGTELFIDGISIETLGLIHLVETRLSSELLHAIITIEKKWQITSLIRTPRKNCQWCAIVM